MKKIYICTIVILSLLLLITGGYTLIHYHFNYSAREWFRESIQDGNYVIVGDEIGDTIFDGGTQVQISIFSSNSHLETFHTTIKNDGKELTEDNYKIDYTKEYLKIKLINHDKKSVSYCFFYDDFT